MKLSRVSYEEGAKNFVITSDVPICESPLHPNIEIDGQSGVELVLRAGNDQPYYALRLTNSETKCLRDLLKGADL